MEWQGRKELDSKMTKTPSNCIFDFMNTKNSAVDAFLAKQKKWQNELALFRSIALDCGLTEEVKWGVPCYTHNGKNILIIHGFKEYCAMNFFKGALLKDTEKILIQQTSNSEATRQIRITNSDELKAIESSVRAYVFEAIEVEKAGLAIPYKKATDLDYPEELIEVFKQKPALKEAFLNLTSGRQKGLILFFAGAKQSATRLSRIEKNEKRIMMGKGIDDCICGKSKRMPRCDGSHNR